MNANSNPVVHAQSNKSLVLGLYLLERNDTPMSGDMNRCVIAAVSEAKAREEANFASKAEGFIWTNPTITDVTRIGAAEGDVAGMIIHSME